MEESRWIKLLFTHWKKGLCSVLLLACLILALCQISNRRAATSKNDFLTAKRSIFEFQKGKLVDSESIKQLEKIALSHPELHPPLDAIFTFTSLEQGKIAEAIASGASSLNRTESYIPSYYADYSRASTLIFENRYIEALDEAEKLAEQLEKKSGFERLEAFNLLRILFLAKKIEAKEKVPLAWEKLKNHSSYPEIETIFSQGECSLKKYLIKEGIEKEGYSTEKFTKISRDDTRR